MPQEENAFIRLLPPGQKLSEGEAPSHAPSRDPKEMTICDVRSASSLPTLEVSGFQLLSFPEPPNIDWFDDEQVRQHYHPLVETVIRSELNGCRAYVVDHRVRGGSVKASMNRARSQAVDRSVPLPSAHTDYTPAGAKARYAKNFPQQEEGRFAIIQAWQPLRGPVLDSPLALLDASSVRLEDAMGLELRYNDWTGEAHLLHHSPDHRWWYTSHMNTNEGYLFYGSNPDAETNFHPGFRVVCPDSSSDRLLQSLIKSTVVAVDSDAPPLRSISLRQQSTQQEVVKRAIEAAVRSHRGGSNVLSQDFGPARSAGRVRQGQTGGGHGGESQDLASSVLLGPAWGLLLSCIGDSLLLYLLLHSSIFVQMANGCYLQVSGQPISRVIQERKAAVPGGTLVFPPLPCRSTSGNHADHPATSAAAHRSSTGGESVDPRGGVWHMQPETRDQTFSPHTQASSQGPSSISGLVQDVCDELLADASSGPLVPGMESRAGPSTVARAGIPLSAASQARRRKPQSAPALSPPLPGHRGPLQAMQAPEAQSRAEHDTIQVHERDCSSDLVQLAAGTNEPSQGDGPAMGRRQWRRAAKLAKWHRRRAPGLTPTQEDDSPCRADPAGLATHDGQSRAAPAGNSNPGGSRARQRRAARPSSWQRRRAAVDAQAHQQSSAQAKSRMARRAPLGWSSPHATVIPRGPIFHSASFPRKPGLPTHHILNALQGRRNACRILPSLPAAPRRIPGSHRQLEQCMQQILRRARRCPYGLLLARHCPLPAQCQRSSPSAPGTADEPRDGPSVEGRLLNSEAAAPVTGSPSADSSLAEAGLPRPMMSMDQGESSAVAQCNPAGCPSEGASPCLAKSSPAGGHLTQEDIPMTEAGERNPHPGVDEPQALVGAWTSHADVTGFVWAVLRRLVPQALLGGKQNRRRLRGALQRFVGLRRHEVMSVGQAIRCLRPTSIPALSTGMRKGPANAAAKTQRLLALWVRWMFAELAAPLLRAHFYVTESEAHRQRVFYYRQPVWAALTAKATSGLVDTMYKRISSGDARCTLQDRQLGIARLRFVPKPTGLRPISMLGCTSSASLPVPGTYACVGATASLVASDWPSSPSIQSCKTYIRCSNTRCID
ncbi:hypothetical protein WJX84_003693 [Apatococcus fuscideae]|uniref:Telomerase reverse transcriptase n=1 Tax=Apatococcus fuscideae TaxID=2026836 RepID=A0AAW1SKY9_9CHLO